MAYGLWLCVLFAVSSFVLVRAGPAGAAAPVRAAGGVARKRNRFARAGAGGSGLPVRPRGAGAARRNCAGRTAERGAVRPSVPGALALAPALRLPARDGTSYQRTTSRDWSSGRANGYAANAPL